MDIPATLAYSLTFAWYWKYPLVMIGAIIEGPVLMIAAGFLLHQQVFEPLPLFIAIASGDFAADIAWYFIGKNWLEPQMRKNGHFLGVTEPIFEKTKELYHKYHQRILILSKVTIGFGMAIPVLMSAGAFKVPFKTYAILNALGEIVIVSAMLSIGYFFSQVYNQISDNFKGPYVAFVAVLAVAGTYAFTKYTKKVILSQGK